VTDAHRSRILGTIALVLGTALYLNLRVDAHDENRARAEHEEEPQRNQRARRAPAVSRADLARLVLAARAAASRDAAHEDRERPHPITSEHLRLYRDVDLLRAADAAIAKADYERARALLAQHHRDLPGMSSVEEEGLLLLADCAQQPSADNVARVQDFYDEHTESSVRRRLRRVCLERR
jgi:hypothetical protein